MIWYAYTLANPCTFEVYYTSFIIQLCNIYYSLPVGWPWGCACTEPKRKFLGHGPTDPRTCRSKRNVLLLYIYLSNGSCEMSFLRMFYPIKPVRLGRWATGKSMETTMRMVDMANYDYSLSMSELRMKSQFEFWLKEWKRVGYPPSWGDTSHLADMIDEYGRDNLLTASDQSWITITDVCGDHLDIDEFNLEYDDPVVTIEFNAEKAAKFFQTVKHLPEFHKHNEVNKFLD